MLGDRICRLTISPARGVRSGDIAGICRKLSNLAPSRLGFPADAIVLSLKVRYNKTWPDLRRKSARPALEAVPLGAECVWFRDETEFLACLLRDAARHELETWWWKLAFGRHPSQFVVGIALSDHPQQARSALSRIRKSGLENALREWFGELLWINFVGPMNSLNQTSDSAHTLPKQGFDPELDSFDGIASAMIESKQADHIGTSSQRLHDALSSTVSERDSKEERKLKQMPPPESPSENLDEAIPTIGRIVKFRLADPGGHVDATNTSTNFTEQNYPGRDPLYPSSPPENLHSRESPLSKQDVSQQSFSPHQSSGAALLDPGPAMEENHLSLSDDDHSSSSGERHLLQEAFASQEPLRFPSEFSGILFGLNALLAMGWIADFTRPLDSGIGLAPWTILDQLGQIYLGKRFVSDPLHDWFLSQAEPLVDPIGITNLTEKSAELIARLATATGWKSSRAFLLLSHCRGVVCDDTICLKVEFSLEHHSLAIRKAGLDRDPGWIESGRRDVRFLFNEESTP